MSVIPLFAPRELPSDWSQQELAELYRVEDTLVQAGMSVETERGLTEEGDPWFVFCRQETGEVIIHFARCDGVYIAVGSFFEGVLAGNSFAAIVRQFLENQPLMLSPRRGKNDSNLFMHPAAMLMALVTTAFLVSQETDPVFSSNSAIKEDMLKGDTLLMRVAQAVRTSFSDVKSAVNDYAGTASSIAPAALLAALLIVEDSQNSQHSVSENQSEDPALEAAIASLYGDQKSSTSEQQASSIDQSDNHYFTENAEPAIAGNNFGDALEQVIDLSPQSVAIAEFIEPDENASIPSLSSNDEANVQTVQSAAFSAIESEISGLGTADPVVESAGSTVAPDGVHKVIVAYNVNYTENAQNNYNFTAYRELNEISAELNIYLSNPIEVNFSAIDSNISGDYFIGLAYESVVEATPSADVLQAETISDGSIRAYDSVADDFVKQFIASATDLTVLLYGSDLVLVDTDQISGSAGHLTVYSWDFQDGSTISVIGIVSDEMIQMIA